MKDFMYGCINEDEFTLRGPRMIDGDECKTLKQAFAQAVEMITEEGVEHVSICRCKLYGPDGDGWWGEVPGDGQITVNAYDVEWVRANEEEEA